MKGFIVKVPVIILLIPMLGLTACSSLQTGGVTSGLPEAGAVPEAVVEADDSNTGTTVVVSQPNTDVVVKEYVVQLIASASVDKAQSIKNEFVSEGYQAYVSPIIVAGQTLHRVQVGPYAAETDAYNMLQSMRQRYHSNAYVNGAVVKTTNGS